MHVAVEDFEALKTQMDELRKELASSNAQQNKINGQIMMVIRQQSPSKPSQRFGMGDSFLTSRSTTNSETDVDHLELTAVQQKPSQEEKGKSIIE